MRGRLAVLIILLLGFPSVAAAQGKQPIRATSDPLGASGVIPWVIPGLPALESPSPYPTVPTPTPVAETYTPTPTATATMTPTATIQPMPTAHEGIATLSADSDQAMATIQGISDGEAMATAAANIGGYTSQLLGYANSLNLGNLRGTGGVISFLILALTFIVLVKLGSAVVPMLATFARWLFDLIRLIGEFIPG